MKYKLEKVFPGQIRLLYGLKKEDTFEKHKIGHVRGDFGKDGDEFWHTWFPSYEELNTRRFKAELKEVVDELRSDSEFPLLKDRKSMTDVCKAHLENRLPDGWRSDYYGFKIRTEHYWYFIKCFCSWGDYNFYIMCYADDTEAERLLGQREQELDVLSKILSKLKIDDIDLWFEDGVLHAKDEDGNDWTGEEFYRFITEECLCFDAEGKLHEGQYVPKDVLEPYVRLSIAHGVVPGADAKKKEE